MSKINKNKLSQIFLTGFGFFLLAIIIYRVGPKVVWEDISRVGYYFFLICFIALSWMFLQAIAWSIIQSAFQKVPFLTLFKGKIMADGMSTLIPVAANMGGEAARAIIIKKHSPLYEGIPGVVFDKTVEYLASLIYLTAGLFLSLIYLKIPEKLKISSIVALSSITILLSLMVILQRKGVYRILNKLGIIFPWGRRWILKKEESLLQFDRNMRLLFHHSRLALILACFLHFLSRCLGALEIYVIIRAMGWPANIVKVVFISVFSVIINTAFFIIPGQWGAAEGGSLLAAASVGYPATIGLSLGLVRRARKIFFALITVILMLISKRKFKSKAIPSND